MKIDMMILFKSLPKKWDLQYGYLKQLKLKTGIKNIHETLDALKNYEFERPEGDYTLIKEPIGVIGMITPLEIWPMNQITTKVSRSIGSRLHNGTKTK